MLKKVNEQVEGQIKKIVEEGLQLNNIDRLYKLVDIHKDIANEEYWKKGYGSKLLSLGIEKAKELGIKDRILVTCDDDNIGSSKVIENNGGILENKVENEDGDETFLTRRYWINIE